MSALAPADEAVHATEELQELSGIGFPGIPWSNE